MRGLLHRVRRFAVAGYLWIAEPRHERLILAAIYGTIATSGIIAIVVVPVVIQNIVGYVGTVSLAGLTAIGGTLALVGVLPDIRPLERLGVSCNGLAYTLYAVVLWGLNTSPLAIGYTVSLALVMLLRLVQIRGPKRAKRPELEGDPWTGEN